jgi:hypothetical protein
MSVQLTPASFQMFSVADSRKVEAASWKLLAGRRELEAGSWNLEAI